MSVFIIAVLCHMVYCRQKYFAEFESGLFWALDCTFVALICWVDVEKNWWCLSLLCESRINCKVTVCALLIVPTSCLCDRGSPWFWYKLLVLSKLVEVHLLRVILKAKSHNIHPILSYVAQPYMPLSCWHRWGIRKCLYGFFVVA